jgi:hypothetical protein
MEAATEAWIREFEEGWRRPAGPDAFTDHFEPILDPEVRLVQPQMPTAWRAVDRLTLRDGLLVERRSFFDPGPLLVDVLTRPRAWPRFVRAQLVRLRARRS